MLYTDEQRQQVREFFNREWKAFSNYFFESEKKATSSALIHFARKYANESGISSAPTALLSEEYMDDKIWKDIADRMYSSLKMLQAEASKAPSPHSIPEKPPGIPRDGTAESISRAKKELGLLGPDAKKAVSPLSEERRLGNPFLSSDQGFPLYHETRHTGSGIGKKNQSGGKASCRRTGRPLGGLSTHLGSMWQNRFSRSLWAAARMCRKFEAAKNCTGAALLA